MPTLFDRRLRFNAALFHQSFGDFVFQVPSIPFVSTNGTDTQVINNNIVTGADAIVRSFDIDAAFQATRNWSIGAAVSYADGRVNDDLVPCRDSNFDGVLDSGQPTLAQFQAAGVFIAQCRTRDAISRDPLWNLSAQSELFVPVGGTSDVYLRGLLNYFPENDRVNIGFTASDYVLLNLYAGLRSSDGGWDVGLFARNLTNAGVQLARDPALITSTLDRTFGNSGYRFTRFTPPREVGISIRYSFGGG